MNLLVLRREARKRLKDEVKPYFWDDAWLDEKINEAVNEACIRSRLIEDDSSPETVLEVSTTERRYLLPECILDVLSVARAVRPDVPLSGWTLTDREIVFARFPTLDESLVMTVIRLPLNPLCADSDTPEIRSAHHIHLLDWVEHRAYGIHDADGFDPAREQEALVRFERAFGSRPSVNTQRKQRAKIWRVMRMATF